MANNKHDRYFDCGNSAWMMALPMSVK